MYQIGEYVIHRADGLCKITDISTPTLTNIEEGKKYYFLIPQSNPRSKVYVAVGSGEDSIRRPLSHDEALELIDSLPEIGNITVENEKLRERTYNHALVKNDCSELFRLIKTTTERNKQRHEKGHMGTAVDESYLKAARKVLYSELSFALGIQPGDVTEFIDSRIQAKQAL